MEIFQTKGIANGEHQPLLLFVGFAFLFLIGTTINSYTGKQKQRSKVKRLYYQSGRKDCHFGTQKESCRKSLEILLVPLCCRKGTGLHLRDKVGEVVEWTVRLWSWSEKQSRKRLNATSCKNWGRITEQAVTFRQ